MTSTAARESATVSQRNDPARLPHGPGRLSIWVAQTTLDDVPTSVRDRAKHLVLDGVACALVGAQLPVSCKGVEGVTALDGSGDAALIGWDGRATSSTSAAMLNSSFIQGFELDDYHPLAPLHSNSLVLPAMLAAAPAWAASQASSSFLAPSSATKRALGSARRSAAWTCSLEVGTRVPSSALSRQLPPPERCMGWTPLASRTRLEWRRPSLVGSCQRCTNRWSSACNTVSPRGTA